MSSKRIKAAMAAAGLMALLTLSSAVEASAGPFAPLSGSWAGAGTITTSSGAKERIRCRAKYNVNGAGSSLDLTLRCAGDSYNFELQSNCNHSNGAVSGTWSELTRHVGGSIEGSARGNNINVRVSGMISAMLAVSTKDNSQSISIQAPGTEMQHVAISLSRK